MTHSSMPHSALGNLYSSTRLNLASSCGIIGFMSHFTDGETSLQLPGGQGRLGQFLPNPTRSLSSSKAESSGKSSKGDWSKEGDRESGRLKILELFSPKR